MELMNLFIFALKISLQVFGIGLKSWYFHSLSVARANFFPPNRFITAVPSPLNPPNLPKVVSETPYVSRVSPLLKHRL